MKKRVLIISTSAGTGHVAAGSALEKAFRADSRVGEVRHEDALDFTNKLFRDFYSKLYQTLIHAAPAVLGWFYKNSDEPWKTDAVRLRLDRLNTGPLIQFIRDYNPDITVCTHFMPAGIISHLIRNQKLDAHLSIVVTDFAFHAMWLSRAFHRYFVALEETKAHLEALGLPEEHITVSGIPIDPSFGKALDLAAVRRRYNLDPDRKTLLVSGGALGVGPTEEVVTRLGQVEEKVQTIVVCGRSGELRSKVQRLVRRKPNFKVIGFTDRMAELMQVADVFIGKPGGLTTSEALACALPMVIVSPIPGQEERNSDFLLETGVAIKCNDLVLLPYKLNGLLRDRQRLRSMRSAAKSLSRPDAAKTVVSTLLHDQGAPPVRLNARKRQKIAEAAAGVSQ
ncbi:MAG: MGDG synthase family glycosyltransferase [Chthoniobacterales bacterium]